MFRDLKIKTKVFITFFIAGLILTGVGIGIFYYFSTKFIETSIDNHLKTVAQSRAHHIETFLENKKMIVENLALIGKVERLLLASESDSDYDAQIKSVQERLQKIIDSIKEITSIAIMDKSGIIIASTNEYLVGIDRSNNEAFLYGKKDTYIQGINFPLEGTKEPIMFSSAPVIKDSKLLGVVVMRITTEKLNEIVLDKTGIGETGETYLVNADGYAISPLLFVEDAVLEWKMDTINSRNCLWSLNNPGIEEMEGEHVGHEAIETYLDYRGEKVIGTHIPIYSMSWCLLAEMDERETLSSLKWIFWITIGLGLFLLFVIYLIANWISRKISKPIIDLRQGAEIIGKGDLDYKVGIDSKDEIGQLSRAFDKMTVAIKQSRADVDKKVKEQTKKIIEEQKKTEQSKVAFEKMNEFMTGRELKMVKLKKEIQKLKGQNK